MAEDKDKKQSFAEIVKRLSGAFVPVSTEPPPVPAETLEAVATRMSNFGYEMSEQALQILLEYLRGYNLWLCGNVGVGKTFFFDCMNKYRNAKGLYPIAKLSMIETQGWTMEDARDWAQENEERDALIDDVGAEPVLNHYGEKVEVFPYLLEKRMQLTRRRTHLTSNLGPADILKRYERRVADRFAQMFKMVEIKARKSRRQVAPWVKAREGSVMI